jgi:LacI family transcriptional regulator
MNSGKPRKSRKTTELADHHHRDLTKRSLGRDPGRAFAGRWTAPYIQAMAVTLRQVAEEAGVSPGTASRALRGHPQVAPDCTARVRAAAARLGYAPLRDRSGRARPQPLEGKRIAIAMFGIDRTLASLPVVAEAIHGAEEALAEAGAHPILVSMADPTEPPRSLRRLKFDGMLAKAALQGRIMEALGPRLRATLGHTPLVWLLGRPAGAPGDVVDPDDATVGRLAAEALLEKGHRLIAIVNPKQDHQSLASRTAAFRLAVEAAGGAVVETALPAGGPVRFPLQPVMAVTQVQPLVDELVAGGRRARSSRPTAIFCPADSIAALVYRALAERELVPGRDIALVSCNHERALVAGLWPSLATIDVHPQRIGRLAVEQLARRIGGQFAGLGVQISVPPTFVPGGSLGPGRR